MKKGKSRNKRKKTRSRLLWIAIAVIGIAAVISAVCVAGMLETKENAWRTPEELLVEYMYHIPKKEYEEIYAMLHVEASGSISQEDFIKRNSAIYEGIEVQNMAVRIIAYDEEQMTVTYQTSFDTVAGTISFENEALFLKDEEGYKLVWDDSMIFRNLTSTDKVRVSTTQAERGEILDRNGRVLAGKGTASSVGIVPGKLENREEAIAQIAELVEITPEAIEKKLSAKWVKDDSFVPSVGMFDSVEAVGFQDIDGDGAKDVIVIINYVTGAGPQGMMPRKTIRIFSSQDNGFVIQHDLMDELMENMKEDDISIPAICDYVTLMETNEIYDGYRTIYQQYFADEGCDFMISYGANGNSRVIAIIFVSILFKHFQNGSVTGNLSIITHFFQCVPDKRIEPIYYPSKIHQITGNSIFVLIVLQFVQQHISHIGFVVIRDQMNRQINTWFQKSHNNRGFQKCSTVNRDISVNSHFLQTSMI